jgi:hypothetical protein
VKGDISIPPLRDLPPGRLAQRREHLLFEITRERESRGALVRPSPSRWGRPGRRRLVALAAAVLVVAVGTASAFSTVRAFFLDRGFIGLPPQGATPSAPERGELVVYWDGFSGTLRPVRGGTMVRAWLYADGRLIWDRRHHGGPVAVPVPEGANELNSGYLEQRLSPEGVALVRAEVAALFDRSRNLLETYQADDPLRSGGPPWGWRGPARRLTLFTPRGSEFSGSPGSMEVPDGDRFVRLVWGGLGANAKEAAWVRKHRQGTIATPEQLSRLRRIDAMLTDPTSVLPPSAWAIREVRAYVPSDYAVCIDIAPPKDASHLLSLLPARAADLLDDKSRTRTGDGVVEAREGHTVVLGQSVTDCYKVETEEAREVADALSGLDREPGWGNVGLAYRVNDGVPPIREPTTIWFEPYFPHGEFTFSGPFG